VDGAGAAASWAKLTISAATTEGVEHTISCSSSAIRLDEFAPHWAANSRSLITFVRTGQDMTAVNTTPLTPPRSTRACWTPAHKFEDGIRETIRWYLDNQDWVKSVLKK